MAYDSQRQRTVLFGGSNGAVLGDTWEWDGTNWTQVRTTNSPPARFGHSLAYDSARKRIVLFGGSIFARSLNDTWEYDGKNWIQMKPQNAPLDRFGSAMAYDSWRQRTVLFSGFNGTYYRDTWEWDGKDWMSTGPMTQPQGRYDYDLMVYDSRRKRMVLFGGFGFGNIRLGDTWEYVGPQTFTGNPSTISIATGGTQSFSLQVTGNRHGNRLYWIFGSVTGTSPGVTLASPVGSVNIPLNPDVWTDATIGFANSTVLTKTMGVLNASGRGSATFNVPKITNQSAIGVKFHHAFLVYDAQNNFYMASNPVELTLVK